MMIFAGINTLNKRNTIYLNENEIVIVYIRMPNKFSATLFHPENSFKIIQNIF